MSALVSFWFSESGFIRPRITLPIFWTAGILVVATALLAPTTAYAGNCSVSCSSGDSCNCDQCNCKEGEAEACYCSGGVANCICVSG